MAKRSPMPVDILVGQNIRRLRLAKGWSQTSLASHLGVTFQQVQKYEKGVNRVGSSRLVQIAEALEVSLADVMKGAHQPKSDKRRPTPLDRLALETNGQSIAQAYLDAPPNVRTAALAVLRAVGGQS